MEILKLHLKDEKNPAKQKAREKTVSRKKILRRTEPRFSGHVSLVRVSRKS